jgi:PAP2 superfamily
MPSRPVAIFAATLVGVLYTLVPEGRWRQLGKWVATGLVAVFALARVHLGVDAPTDVVVGAVIGVAVSVAAYRLFVPNEVFPVAYRRGRAAHLDVGGRRGEAIRHALADQLGLSVLKVEPFGLSGSAGSTPLRIKVEDGAGTTRYVFGKLYAKATYALTVPTSWTGRCCTGGWRTRSRSTPCGGWCSRRITRCR